MGSAVNLTGRIESYTTGSQILLSPTTYAATAAVLTITQTLTVAPKGVPAPITLYDVGGIGGAHQLFLPEHHEELRPVLQTVPIRYTVLEGKFAGPMVLTGRLVKLAAKAAELHTDEPVASLSNLKLHLLHPNGEAVPRGPVCQGRRCSKRADHTRRDPLHLRATGRQDLFGCR